MQCCAQALCPTKYFCSCSRFKTCLPYSMPTDKAWVSHTISYVTGERTVPMLRTSVLPDSFFPRSLSIAFTSTLAAGPPFITDSGYHCGYLTARTNITNSALFGSTGGVGGACAAVLSARHQAATASSLLRGSLHSTAAIKITSI